MHGVLLGLSCKGVPRLLLLLRMCVDHARGHGMHGLLQAYGQRLTQLLLVLCCALQDGRIDYAEFCAMMRQGNEEVMKASTAIKTGIIGVKQPRITS